MAKLKIQLTKKQQQTLALAALLVCGGGYAYIRYFWLPISRVIEKKAADIKDIEAKIDKAKSQAVRLPKIQKEIETLNEQAIEAEKRLPKSRDLPAVIITMAALARQCGVELKSISPGGLTMQQYFIEVPYQISARGRYHDIGRFLAAIALEQRIFNVRNVNYGAPDPEGKLVVNFNLISYQYKG